jgi:hypothetical protein
VFCGVTVRYSKEKLAGPISVLGLAAVLLATFVLLEAPPWGTPSAQPTQMLAYYSNSETISVDAAFPEAYDIVTIYADKPVLFTVSVDLRNFDYSLNGDNDYVFIGSDLGRNIGQDILSPYDYMLFKVFDASKMNISNGMVQETITFSSMNMTISTLEMFQHFDIKWSILVQGSQGTVLAATVH